MRSISTQVLVFACAALAGGLAGNSLAHLQQSAAKPMTAMLQFSTPVAGMYHVAAIPEPDDKQCLIDGQQIQDEQFKNQENGVQLACVLLNFPGGTTGIVSYTGRLPPAWEKSLFPDRYKR